MHCAKEKKHSIHTWELESRGYALRYLKSQIFFSDSNCNFKGKETKTMWTDIEVYKK
jgi:hypothetical protein